MTSVQAIVVHAGGTEREFRPDGDIWELTMRGPFGETPGGHWPATAVAEHLVDAVYDRQTPMEPE